ncbi:Anaphase-promoting complex subunit 10 [Thoreauomyces humboldtii]|nr:Anaphase-promoting complex subunit 10 [Thoreauomyces humboldtii]
MDLCHLWISEPADDRAQHRDVSTLASISVSSYKEEHPPQHLTDGNPDTYWQSDGPQPHYVNVEFPQRMTLTKVSIYVDLGKDESYTPREINVKAGNSLYDLQDLQRFDIGEGTGWQEFVLFEDEETMKPLSAFVVQISVLENFQHGKDTHIRGLKFWAPCSNADPFNPKMPSFSTLEFQM